MFILKPKVSAGDGEICPGGVRGSVATEEASGGNY